MTDKEIGKVLGRTRFGVALHRRRMGINRPMSKNQKAATEASKLSNHRRTMHTVFWAGDREGYRVKWWEGDKRYVKSYGRWYFHSQKVELQPGEVVVHVDNDKRNIEPSNLAIKPQSEVARDTINKHRHEFPPQKKSPPIPKKKVWVDTTWRKGKFNVREMDWL